MATIQKVVLESGFSGEGGETLKNTYVENVCTMFRRNGLSPKYEYPGIYCIKLDERVVYIGKSQNMLERIAAHYVGIETGSERKYRIMKEARDRLDCPVCFDVLYYAQSETKEDIIEEIGQKEGELIRQYRPLLNTQIPKAEDWRKWEVKKIDAEEVLRLLLDE